MLNFCKNDVDFASRVFRDQRETPNDIWAQELQYGRRGSTASVTAAAGESDQFHFNFYQLHHTCKSQLS